MKWLRRIFIALLATAGVLAGLAFMSVMKSEHRVGFQAVQATDSQGQAFVIGVWYPTQARPWPKLLGPLLINVATDAPVHGRNLPLVVVSHGNGGGVASHADLALALASAGYVVAAPMHTGDNYADQSAVGAATLFSGRNRELRATVDVLLEGWSDSSHLDAERVGVFGFSAGGLTALTAVGAKPDFSVVGKHCIETPEFACAILREAGSPLLQAEGAETAGEFTLDPRIKAAVVVAPGMGFTLRPGRLDGVRVPVQLWSGEHDDAVPYTSNVQPVREGLGSNVEFHLVAGAGHMSFLAPCGLLKPPRVCSDPDGFDRDAFHARMNTDIRIFFDRTLSAW